MRLSWFDYSASGAYFVTICSRVGGDFFGRIVDEEMICNAAGELVTACWNEIPQHFPLVKLDAFVMMPDHLHGILLFGDSEDGKAPHLPAVVGSFKSAVSRRASQSVWQRSYWERIIRNEKELNSIRRYVDDNPRRWAGKAGHARPLRG